jgi:hypothetical protein
LSILNWGIVSGVVKNKNIFKSLKKQKMKKLMITAVILFMASTATFAQAQMDTAHKHKQKHKNIPANKFTCPMHPEVITTKPGKCPNCGMVLVPVKKKVGKGKRKGHGHS